MRRKYFLVIAIVGLALNSTSAQQAATPSSTPAAKPLPPFFDVYSLANSTAPTQVTDFHAIYPYSGISGSGMPVEGNGEGGWRSGSEGVLYAGNHPKPYFTLVPLSKLTTRSAVTSGILPPIKPFMEVQVRDTVITLGGDGNYYMTGSTGENIWAFNDGVELWRSPDLEHWT